jgi:predicted metal-binding protein
MKPVELYCKEVSELGVDGARVIDPRSVVTAEDVTTPCKHGFEARPSMESCSIDVFKTARDNGFPVEVVKTHQEERNIFGLILVE